jgi:hypothetical protein
MASAIEKRIASLEHQVGSGRERTIVIKIPILLTPVEGSVECAPNVTPEIRAAVDEMLHAVGYTDVDTVIEIIRFYQASKTNGNTEPTPVPSPELISAQ